MTAHGYIRRMGPAEAVDISCRLMVPIDDVYAELIPLESRGLVRIVVTHERGLRPVCRWESMAEPERLSTPSRDSASRVDGRCEAVAA